MIPIEIALLVIVLILIIVLIYQNYLAKIFVSQSIKNRSKIDVLIRILKNIYSFLQKARRFSLVYIFKNKFYNLYLIVAISVVFTHLFLHYNPQTIYKLPVWIGKIIDFLIVSSAWEIICIITKIIDEKISKK